ncbi:hypothetical protein BYT27DRAFT_7114899 [Phlegmacium glaucopus]|nr:hypothetical protein BYT27DRAFT_7114899 [Phlegmacium glaucopus]
MICILTSSSWAPHRVAHSQQLIDILHVSHMWDILPGIEFASTQLLDFNLLPAHRLYLARQYNLLDWVPSPIRILLSAPLEQYTTDSKDHLDFELYMIIATAKESIAAERKRLGNYPPFPKNFDDEPFCAQHGTCRKVWSEKWFCVILRRIHHPVDPLPLSSIPEALEGMEHRGMNLECKRSILTWLKESCDQVQKEEVVIQATIATVCKLFM